MNKIDTLIFLKKTPHNHNTNSQVIITFTNRIVYQINMTSLLKDELCQFPIKNVHLSRTFKYPISLGSCNSFSKSSTSITNFTCKCNNSAYKLFIDGDHGPIII